MKSQPESEIFNLKIGTIIKVSEKVVVLIVGIETDLFKTDKGLAVHTWFKCVEKHDCNESFFSDLRTENEMVRLFESGANIIQTQK